MLLPLFLRQFDDGIFQLEQRGISAKRHPFYSNLVQFNYSQIDTPKNDPIGRECRGLILDEENNWNSVAFPFVRFFNYGEPEAAIIDWSSAKIQEKLDGSLIIMYHYDNKWHVATRNSPSAAGNVGESEVIFSDLFWNTFVRKYGFSLLDTDKYLNPKYTYLWELTSPLNRVVVDYQVNNVTLIGVRQNVSPHLEIPVSAFSHLFKTVQSFPLNSVEDVLEASKHLNPLEQEGYVVVDKLFNRVKIKSPKYVLIHHMKDGFGTRRIIDLIKLGERNEILAYYPEYQKLFDKISTSLDYMIDDAEKFYISIKDIKEQKAFALEALKHRLYGAMFAVRKGQTKSIREFVLNMPTVKIEEMLP